MPSRRRGAELEAALLQAAWDELVEKGYASFTLDAVADRAHTSRPVLYRRWPDRHELVRAAIAQALEGYRLPVPDTGGLRDDVLALLRELNATRVPLVTIMSVQLAGYYQETGTSPADLKNLLSRGRRDYLGVIFARASARGDIAPERVTERMKSLPFDLLRQEFMTTFRPVPDEVLVEIVDTIFLPLVQPGTRPLGGSGVPDQAETRVAGDVDDVRACKRLEDGVGERDVAAGPGALVTPAEDVGDARLGAGTASGLDVAQDEAAQGPGVPAALGRPAEQRSGVVPGGQHG